MTAIDFFLSHVGVVLTWEDVHGSRSTVEEIREAIREMHPYTLLAFACHWNALVSPPDQVLDPSVQRSILELLHSREQVAAVSRAIAGKPNVRPDGVVNKHQLLLLARLLLEDTDWAQSIPDEGRVPGPPLFDALLKLNDHLAEPPPTDARRKARSKYLSFGSMFTMQDLFHRRNAAGAIARTLGMLGEIHSDLKAESKGWLDVHSLFEQAAGLPVASFHHITFAAYSLARPRNDLAADRPETTAFTAKALQGESAAPPAHLQAYLDGVSLRPQQFKERLSLPTEMPVTRNFAVFRDSPMVQIADGVYRAIDPDFLLNKLGDGIFWYLHRGALNRNQVKELRGWWGRLFEEYTHRLMEHYFAPEGGRYIRNPRFEGQPDEAIDALLVLPYAAVLFEFKASLVKREARHSADPRKLALDIREKFASKKTEGRRATGVTQLARAIERFVARPPEGGRRLGPLKPSVARRIYPVLVCFDPAMSAPLMNCFLAREFRKALGSFDSSRIRPLTVMTIENLEDLLPYTEEHSFKDLLDAWHTFDPDMHTSCEVALDEWVRRVGSKENAWIREKWQDWTKEVTSYFFPKRTPD